MDIAAAAVKLAADATRGEEPEAERDPAVGRAPPARDRDGGRDRGGFEEGRGPRGRRDRTDGPPRRGRGGARR